MVVMKVKRAKAKKMIKIVYFDEGSATDFIYVLTGGKSTDKKEHIVTKSSELAVGAEAEAIRILQGGTAYNVNRIQIQNHLPFSRCLHLI